MLITEKPDGSIIPRAQTNLTLGRSPGRSSNGLDRDLHQRLRRHRLPVMNQLNDEGLFQAVVAMSGLAPIIAPAVVRRALQRAGVEPAKLSGAGLLRAIDSLESALKVYLPANEVAERIAALRRLAR